MEEIETRKSKNRERERFCRIGVEEGSICTFLPLAGISYIYMILYDFIGFYLLLLMGEKD